MAYKTETAAIKPNITVRCMEYAVEREFPRATARRCLEIATRKYTKGKKKGQCTCDHHSYEMRLALYTRKLTPSQRFEAIQQVKAKFERERK